MESIIIKFMKTGYKKTTDIENLCKYISGKGRKEQNIIYLRGTGCSSDPDKAAAQFIKVQEWCKKNKGRLCYHLVVSFPLSMRDDWISTHISDCIGDYIFEELGFQTIFSIHKPDKDYGCIHTHYLINAVNYINRKKLHMNKKELGDFKRQLLVILNNVLSLNGWRSLSI